MSARLPECDGDGCGLMSRKCEGWRLLEGCLPQTQLRHVHLAGNYALATLTGLCTVCSGVLGALKQLQIPHSASMHRLRLVPGWPHLWPGIACFNYTTSCTGS